MQTSGWKLATDLARGIAKSIIEAIAAGDIADGEHMSAQKLADKFGVSRSPVREALLLLAKQGYAVQEAQKGFFARLRRQGDGDTPSLRRDELPFEAPNTYQEIADDWLSDRIPAEVTEQMLRERYALTKSQLNDILMRASREGWAEPKPGYGWNLLPVAKTPEAFEQAYRFRMVIEPAAMLEPTYQIDRNVLEELRRQQSRMLDTDIERLPGERLMELGAHFHEELVRQSGNPFFYQALVRVNRMRRLMEYRSRVDRRRLYTQCAQHLEILKLLESGDVVAASYMMRKHLAGALNVKSPVILADALP
jgi:DNA-binding GntR family transcriptional regulator